MMVIGPASDYCTFSGFKTTKGTTMNATPINFVAHKRKRGETMTRAGNRDDQRDAVMKMVFAKPGFAAEVARHLGVTHQNVSAWKKVPPHHVVELAAMLDMTPEQIRPDIFGRRRRR